MNKEKEPSDLASTGGRIKSPQYPYSTLKEAIEDAENIFSKNKNLVILQEAAARHLGYSGLNGGLAARRLSSLKQFGLAEFPQTGRIKLSHLFTRLKFAADERERVASVAEALHSPPLFKELFESFGGIESIPSDPSLRSLLVREKNFNPDFVDKFLKTLRDSVKFLMERGQVLGDRGGFFDDLGTDVSQLGMAPDLRRKQGALFHAGPLPVAPPGDGFDQVSIRLPDDRRAVLLLPHDFFEEDKECIRRQLDVIWCSHRPEVELDSPDLNLQKSS